MLPLSDWAVTELQALKTMADGSRFVLPNGDGSAPDDPKYVTRSVARCLKRFSKYGVAAFTPHDLRRTARTGLGRLGIKIDIAERVLNHARNRIEATYDLHEYIDEKRDALTRWAQYLERLRDISRELDLQKTKRKRSTGDRPLLVHSPQESPI